jgi:hypothetical protein
MTRLTTRVSSGILAVYCGRAKVGYVAPGTRGDFIWELILVSEQLRGHPRGLAPTREAAIEKLDGLLRAWMQAAGVEFQFKYTEDNCPGHSASSNPKICRHCGVRVDSLR